MMSSALLLATLAAGAAAQLTINTPTEGGTTAGAPECQALLLGFSGGSPPYIITWVNWFFCFGLWLTSFCSVDTSPIGTTHIAEFDNVSGTTLSWPAVNASLNTQLILTIKDSTGATANSGTFPVTSGSDSCLTGSGSTTGGTTGGSTTGGTGTTATTGGTPTTGGGSNTGSANPSSTKPASSSGSSAKSSGSSSSTAGAATAVHAPAGVVPAFAAVVLAGLVALLA